MANPPHAMADPPRDSSKWKFTGIRKKSGIANCKKNCKTSSAEGAIAVHAAPDALAVDITMNL